MNISSLTGSPQVEGADWQRQRKITSIPFNDLSSNIVWNEAVTQARQVLAYWTSQRNPITNTVTHVRTLSLHVLSNAGFGKAYSFEKASEPPKPGHVFNYRDALAHILDDIMMLMIFGPNALRSKFLPSKIFNIGQAAVDFKAYMRDMYADEKRSMETGKKSSANIMSSLIRANEEMNLKQTGTVLRDQWCTSATIGGLSESEIYGNTFVYNFAGHDTTAITLSWTLYLLAAHPQVQEWLGEEIDEYIKAADLSSMRYNEIFPRLKRCLAVMVGDIKMSIRIHLP